MRIRLAVPDSNISADIVDHALEAVTRTNERLLEEGRVPLADDAIRRGVKWAPEPPGDEHFDHALTVVKRGHGDCDDLAPYKAASLRVTGEDPDARATIIPSGPNKWHAIVLRGDGSVDDPSADAGMYEYRKKSLPLQPKMRGGVRTPTIHTSVVGGVHVARCDVPWRSSDYALSSHAAGPNRVSAVRRAIVGACIVGDASGAVTPDMVQRMAMLDELLKGVPPEHVRAACLAWLQEHGQPATAVGSFFGNVLKGAAHLVPIPGVSQAFDFASGAASALSHHHGGRGGAPGSPPVAPDMGPTSSGHYAPSFAAPHYEAPHYGAPPVVVVRGW
jgi:hypothetical protein